MIFPSPKMPLSVNVGQSFLSVSVENRQNCQQNGSELRVELVGHGRKWSEFGHLGWSVGGFRDHVISLEQLDFINE